MKKEKGEKKKGKSNRAGDSDSGTQDNKGVIKQEDVSISRQHSSLDSDSSPERPLIEVLRSIRRNGEKAKGSASGHVGMSRRATEESEDERGRKMVRDAGKRGGGTRGGR